jgi:acyl-coenzyme A thioesterase PaaI-like protein
MDIRTHLLAHRPLLGTPVEVVDGEKAVVRLVAIENMVVDDNGLIHGGFTFGLADYAAMLAVNDPNVVIIGANVSFVAPVKRGDVMVAEAMVTESRKRKRKVNVVVSVGDSTVFRGELTCFVLDKHVLAE